MSQENALARGGDLPRRAVLLLAALLVLVLAFAPRAEAFIYWTDSNVVGTIGRAKLDGSKVSQTFITGANGPVGVAVDAGHVYWVNSGANEGAGTIGRAKLTGEAVDQSFISTAGHPYGVAVDAAHVYWTNAGAGTIGRANLDGSGVDQSFITGASSPLGVAVDAAHVYWTSPGAGTIGRANLDGSGADQSFIAGASLPRSVAVNAAHVYWTDGASRQARSLRDPWVVARDESGPLSNFTETHGRRG